MKSDRLFRLLWLSVAAALATITLKTVAYLLTGSVGLLSDAAESVVNLVAAVVAILALRFALKPADEDHAYGHQKAEYFSAGVEGTLVLVAAVTIGITAFGRLLDPQPIDSAGIGLAVSAGATLINLAVGVVLLRAGREERSIVLEADGKHLITDVWTSVGVIAGVAAVALTGWEILDPLIALAVAVNIIVAGGSLVWRSADGLMDRALDGDDRAKIDAVLTEFREREDIDFHALRTRQAGSRAFVSVHVLVPGAWTVQHGHDMVERVEDDLRARLPHATIFTHLEPVEDPKSFTDIDLDRAMSSSPPHRP
ncbi:cation diffusion facilitator family transporter [Solirubrobacter phytolaccae]|uniref:Cation diffusion facilitator family transporter n=1 Tax=Solirubrobacter phytolaccae TaxID=1404360 RepID=A0A9X3NFM9_9ACTN|nr:cation diffusion facilitator family transporter [Solirubrobacter phytolaccae]MDA0185728.1 cation diffusion facilitator family transporter [Solirubrobacter phytolaccae]